MKEFWFQFLASPSKHELRILNPNEVLMSPFDTRLATAASPLYLSLNALLVLSANSHIFTQFCQDKRILKVVRTSQDLKNNVPSFSIQLIFRHICEQSQNLELISELV